MTLDPEKLRWHGDRQLTKPTPTSILPVRRTAGGRVDGLFIKGPIPVDWLSAATSLPGKATVSVSLALWFLWGMKKSDAVRLTHKTEAMFNVKPRAANRALERLAAAGLVSVEQKPGRSPVVTILPPPTQQQTCESPE